MRERRNQLIHPVYAKPELLATAPHQVWSWDITKLKGPAKWTCFHLYVILDIFSRYVVGWMIALREAAELAEQLIADTVAKHNIAPGTLTLHADRGTSMRSKPVAHCWSIWMSPRRTAGRMSRMTIRTPRRSSKRSSTAPTSPSASAASRMPAPIASGSSTGTTPRIVTAASAS